MSRAIIWGGLGAYLAAVSAGATGWSTIGGLGQCASTSESARQIRWDSAGTFDKFEVLVVQNSINTGNSTARVRVNGANVNLTVSIAAGATGSFTDSSNSDTIAAGDLVSVSLVASGSSGTITPRAFNAGFSATSNTVSKLIIRNGTGTFNADRYAPLSGDEIIFTTEWMGFKFRTAGTLKNLSVNVTATARTSGSITWGLRKNGATDVTTGVTYAAGATGRVTDTSFSATVADGELWNYIITQTNADGGVVSWGSWALEFETTNGCWMIASLVFGPSAGTSNYMVINNNPGTNSTDSASGRSLAAIGLTVSKLFVGIEANTSNGAHNLYLRKGTADQALTVSIPATSTTAVEDTTNSVSFAATDTLHWRMANAGGSGAISYFCYSALVTPSGTTGDLALTLGAAELSAASAAAIVAATSQTLGEATIASGATVGIVADLGVTLGDVTLSATASYQGLTVDLDMTLGAVELSGAATVASVAALSETLGDATGTAASAAAIVADLGVTLGELTLLCEVSSAENAATLAQTLADVTASSAGTVAIVADSAVTLGDVTASAAGTVAMVAALAQTLGAMELSADANSGLPRTAGLAVTLDDVGLNLTGTVTQPASESTGAGGGVVMRRRKRQPAFTVTQDTQQIIEQRIAALSVTLDDAQLLAECTMHEAPLARRRRQTLAVLLS